jgi:hypothetical protein
VGLGLVLLSGPAAAEPSAAPRATTVPKAIVAPSPRPPGGFRELYSTAARRLVRTYLRLQLLELREAELDRVRSVIEGKLGVDALFPPSPAQTPIEPPVDKTSSGRNDTLGHSR